MKILHIMTSAKVVSSSLPGGTGFQAGAVVTSPTIGFLLKQVYALHKDIVRGLETEVLQLKRGLAESQTRNGPVEPTSTQSTNVTSHTQVSPNNCKRRRIASQSDDSADVTKPKKEECELVREVNAAERKQPYRSLQRRCLTRQRQHNDAVQDSVKLETEYNTRNNFKANKQNTNLAHEKSCNSDNEILCLDTPYMVDMENGTNDILKCGVVAETLGVSDDCDDIYSEDSNIEKRGCKDDSEFNEESNRVASKRDMPVRVQKQKTSSISIDPACKVKSRGIVSPVLFVEDADDDDVIEQRVAKGRDKLRETIRESNLESMKASECTKLENKPDRSKRSGLAKNSKTDLSVLKSLKGKVEIVNGGKELISSKPSKKTGTYLIEFNPNAKPVNSAKLKQTKITKDSFNALSKPRLRSASSLDHAHVTEEMEQQWLQEALRKSLLQDEDRNRIADGNEKKDSDSCSGSDQSISLLNVKEVASATELISGKCSSPEKNPCAVPAVGVSRNETVAEEQLQTLKVLRSNCEHEPFNTSGKRDYKLIHPSPQTTLDRRKNCTITNVQDDEDSLDETCIASPTLLENLQPPQTFNKSLMHTKFPPLASTAPKLNEQVATNQSDDTLDETCCPSQLLLELGLPEADNQFGRCNGSLDPNVRLSLYESCAYDKDEDESNSASKLTRNLAVNDEAKIQDRHELSDFDRVPKKPTADYKFKELPVRNRDERKKLEGYACKCCKEYYEALGLTEEEIKGRMKDCSRHRDRHAPPQTPEHFWSIGFPDTPECKARGYILPTQVRPLRRKKKKHLLEGSIIATVDDSFLDREK